MGRRAKLLVKFAVTALLFWVVFSAVDVSRMSALLGRAQPGWLALSLGLVFVMIALDGLAFCVVMRTLGHRVSFGASLLYSLVGWFFSNIAPSTLGGDIFRTVQMQRLGAPIGTTLRSVLTMRIMSFAALIAVILAGLPIALAIVRNDVERATLVFIAACGVAVLLAAYGSSRLVPRLRGAMRGSLLRRTTMLAEDFWRVHHAGWDTVWCWALASAQHVVRVVVLAALAASLHLGIPVTTLFALVPAALLVAMIPISFGSWGLREAAFVVFLGGAGVAPEAALSLSIAFGLLRVVVGGIGGLTWLAVGRDSYGFELDVGSDNSTSASSKDAGIGSASTASTLPRR